MTKNLWNSEFIVHQQPLEPVTDVLKHPVCLLLAASKLVLLRFEYDQLSNVGFLIINIIVIELSIIFPTHHYSKTQKPFQFILLIDADGLFSGLIRSHYNWAIVIKVSYVKEYNREQNEGWQSPE